MKGELAIVTVVHNNYQVLEDFFKSLEKQTNQNFKLFVVDNSDNPQKLETDPPAGGWKLETIRSANLGYAHGINIGLKKAIEEGFDLFCAINNDTYFEKDFINQCLAASRNHLESIIGAKIYYAPGYEYHKDRYLKRDLGKVIWYAGGVIDWNHALTRHIGVDEVDRGQFDKIMKTEFVTGCLMLFNKTALNRIGFWDESYFLYFEDADWCMRAQKNGVNLVYDPEVTIWHKNSESTGKSGSPLQVKYQRKNRLKFGLKYAPLRTKLHLLKNYLLR